MKRLLALALALLLALTLFGCWKKPEPSPAPTAGPTPDPGRGETVTTATPAPEPTDGPMATPEPMETFQPAPENTAQPTPEPLPEETEEPVIVNPNQLASGSFRSDTGTGLNLRADWRVYTDDAGAHKMRVDLSVSSYRLVVGPLWNSLVLTVDGRSYYADSPAVNYEGETVTSTPLYSFVIDAPAGNSFNFSAAWNFHGSYSGTDLNSIVASGVIQLS